MEHIMRTPKNGYCFFSQTVLERTGILKVTVFLDYFSIDMIILMLSTGLICFFNTGSIKIEYL